MKKKISSKTNETFIRGTRIPVSYLFDYFKEGLTITDFLSSYPWVKKEDVINALEDIKGKSTSKYAF